MKCFVVTPGMGEHPTAEGIYAAEVFHGWKLLEWKDGAWWHLECTGRWEACEPVQWLGPLPERVGQKGTKTPLPDFDL